MTITVSTVRPKVQVPCVSCKQRTWHEVVHNLATGDDDPESGWHTTEQHQIIKCCGCDALSFRRTYEDATWGPDEPATEVLWPPRVKKRQSLTGAHQLPKKVYQIYRETNASLEADQPLLAAVGVRALVEAVCRQKRATGKNLKLRIDNLVTRGLLTKAQARVLHKTRFLGNKAAHETAPADAKVLEASMLIAEHMLTAVYLLPKIARPMSK